MCKEAMYDAGIAFEFYREYCRAEYYVQRIEKSRKNEDSISAARK